MTRHAGKETTLHERLAARLGAAAGDRSRIGFYDRPDRLIREQSQQAFIRRAFATGRRLRDAGVGPGDPVLLVTPSPEASLTLLLAATSIGAVPAIHPVRPAFDSPTQLRAGIDQALAVLGHRTWVITTRAGEEPVAATERLLTIDPGSVEVSPDDPLDLHRAAPGDPCHLQMTSGSTSAPKPVVVTHEALLANVDGIIRRGAHTTDDVIVSWLPLYHDMGLVGQALLPLVAGAGLHLMSPFDFIADPSAWLRAVSDKGGTMSATPTFGLEQVLRRVPDRKLADLDLSSWRRIYCGAEPVPVDTLHRFAARLAPFGFDARTLIPTFGLAEASLAVTMPHLDGGRRWLEVTQADLGRLGRIHPTGSGDGFDDVPAPAPGGVLLAALGPPLDGLEVWIRDESGRRIDGDGHCGEVVVRGSSVTAGYLRPDGSVEPFPDGVLATGDVGFLHDGELYVLERLKNIIIRNGENHSAQLLEEALAEVTGVPIDQVAVIDSDLRPGHGLVTAVVEIERKGDPVEVEARVRAALDRFELPLEELVVVRPGAIPRTTSGKKRHAELRALLQEGGLKVLDRFPLSAHRQPADDGLLIDLDTVDAVNRARAVVARMAADRGVRGEPVDQDRFAQDLAFDSLALYELVMVVEAETDVEIAEDDIAELRTVGDLLGLVQARRAEPLPERRGLSRLVHEVHDAVPQVLKQVKAQRGRRILVDGRWVTDFASCNYLGLDLHPEVMSAIPAMIEEFGVHPSWTRAVASPAPYARLEQALADLVGTSDTVVFPTVTLTHFGVLPRLTAPGGTLLLDQAAHHSMHEAGDLARARGATVATFPHGDLAALERLLTEDRNHRRVIAVDGVYSMAGSVVDLAALQDLARRHDATIYVDDAHGFGVLGEGPGPSLPYGLKGNGVVRHLGLDYERTVYVAGLSKAYSSMAAFIGVNSPEERRLVEGAGTMIFGGPVPTASLASALAGLQVNAREGDLLRMRLWQLTRTLLAGIRELGFHVDTATDFPIVNVILGPLELVRRAAEILWEHGILLTPAVFPAAPLDRGGVRFTVTSANTEGEVDQLLHAMATVRDAVGVGLVPAP